MLQILSSWIEDLKHLPAWHDALEHHTRRGSKHFSDVQLYLMYYPCTRCPDG